MLLRWLARILLTVAALYAASFAAFLLVSLASWGNILSAVVGIAVAVAVWIITRPLTAGTGSTKTTSDNS